VMEEMVTKLQSLIQLLSARIGIAPASQRAQVSGTPLSALAASMAPGTWAPLSVGGLTNLHDSGPSGSGNRLSYAMSTAWDPIGRKLYFQGQDHNSVLGLAFLQYDDATNAWSIAGSIPNIPSHGYDHLTID
jgi:hypothetical protein